MFIVIMIKKNKESFYLRKILDRFFYNAQCYIL